MFHLREQKSSREGLPPETKKLVSPPVDGTAGGITQFVLATGADVPTPPGRTVVADDGPGPSHSSSVSPVFDGTETLGLSVTNTAVVICGCPVRTLWDEQATRTVITAAAAKRLGLTTRDTGRVVRVRFAALGSARTEPERETELAITLHGDAGKGQLSFKAKALVSDIVNAFPLILGKDVLAWLSVKYGLSSVMHKNLFTLTLPDRTPLHVTANEGQTSTEGVCIFTTEVTSITENAESRLASASDLGAERTAEMREREAKLKREFKDVFGEAETSSELGSLPATLHVELNGPLPPLRMPRRFQFSAPQLEFLDERLDHLIATGVVRPIAIDKVLHLSPFFVVPKPKKDPSEPTKWREITDLRAVNAVTKREHISTPKMEDLLERVARDEILSVVDVRSAFHLCPISEFSERLFAFRDHRDRILTWTRCPFGASGSPACFNRGLEAVLGDLRAHGVDAYVDDLAVHTKGGLDPHEEALRRLLTRCREYKMKVNEKSLLFAYTIPYLGREVSHNSIVPVVDRANILAYPAPTSRKHVRSFLGLANHFKSFIKGYSDLAAPLYELTSKHAMFEWEPHHQRAFARLRDALASPEVLHPPSADPNVPIRVTVDTSLVAVGAHVEEYVDRRWVTVGFFSTKLSPREQRYGATAREGLGLLYALRKYRHLLENKQITFVVDCLPLIRALEGDRAFHDPRWERVLTDLLAFSFSLVHLSGKENVVADALSRPQLPVGRDSSADLEVRRWRHEGAGFFATELLTVPAPDVSWATDYEEDPYTAAIIRSLEKQDANSAYLAKKYSLVGGLLLFLDPMGRRRLMVPRRKVQDALSHYHDTASAGHPGAERMTWIMSQSVFFPKMARVIEKYVFQCHTCGMHKKAHNTIAAMQPAAIPSRAMESVALDFIGGMPDVEVMRDGVTFLADTILVVTCQMSRVTAFIPTTKHLDGEGAAELFLHEFCVARGVGTPRVVVSDRDPRFTAKEFRMAMEQHSIKQQMTVRDHAEANGSAEIMCQAVSRYLRLFCSHQPTKWPQYLKFAEFSVNNNLNAAIGRTPAEVLLGFRPTFGWGRWAETGGQAKTESQVVADVEQAHALIAQAAQDELNLTRDKYVLSHAPAREPVRYKKNQLVWISTECLVPPELRSVEHKLQARYSGPHRVIKIISDATIRVELPRTARGHDVIGVKDVKPYITNQFPDRPQQATLDPSALEPGTFEVEAIVGYEKRGRAHFFKVRWLGYPDPKDHTFEGMQAFCDSRGNVITTAVRDYVRDHKLDVPLDVTKRKGKN